MPLEPFRLDPACRLVSLADAEPGWHLHLHRDADLWLAPVLQLLVAALQPALERAIASGQATVN